MKKNLTLLIVLLSCVTDIFAQPGSPGGGVPPPEDLPIDSEIILLFGAAIVLGIYKVMQNKKRQLEK